MNLIADLGLDAEWRTRARCLGADTEVFFPVVGQGVDEALALCADCDVRPECLEAALAVDPGDDFGVWGGMTEQGRRRLRAGRRVLPGQEVAA